VLLHQHQQHTTSMRTTACLEKPDCRRQCVGGGVQGMVIGVVSIAQSQHGEIISSLKLFSQTFQKQLFQKGGT